MKKKIVKTRLTPAEQEFIRLLRHTPKSAEVLAQLMVISKSYVWVLANRKNVKPLIMNEGGLYALTTAGVDYVTQVREAWK